MSLVNWKKNMLLPTMSNLVDSFFEDELFNRSSDPSFFPAVNVKENDTAFKVELAAPGYEKGDFEISIDNGRLVINSEKSSDKEDANENFTRKEYHYNAFQRSFTMPENVNEDAIKADYHQGVLKIELPKLEKAIKKASKLIEVA